MCDPVFMESVFWMLMCISSYAHFAESLKTVVSDELVTLLNTGTYNKLHLPAYANRLKSFKLFQRSVALQNKNVHLSCFEDFSGTFFIKIEQEPAGGKALNINASLAMTINSLHELIQEVQATRSREADVRSLVAKAVQQIYLAKKFHNALQNISLSLAEQFGHLMFIIHDDTAAIELSFSDVDHFVNEAKDVLKCESVLKKQVLTNVTIGVYVESMSSVKAQTMDFHMDIYLSEIWQDLRLAHNNLGPMLIRSQELLDKIWRPDVYFANAKTATFHFVTASNFLLYIWPNGTLIYDTRVTLIVNCILHLRKYPLDSQECGLRILSYAYDNDSLLLDWKKETAAITINPDIKLPDMALISYTADYCVAEYDTAVWSCVFAKFHMKRQIMFHILQNYIPTTLIVVASWFNFWLDIDAVPGRVSLSITTLLTLTTLSSAARMQLPEVSYAKAIDIWMGTCVIFVFGVLFEFTLVNYIGRLNAKKVPPSLVTSSLISADKATNNSSVAAGDDQPLLLSNRMNKVKRRLFNCENAKEQMTPLFQVSMQQFKQFADKLNRTHAENIDKKCRFLFPLVFLIFNCFYWPYYLLLS